MCNGINDVFDWTKQKKVLDECLSTIRGIIATLPPELQVKPSSQPGQSETSPPQYYPPATSYAGIASNSDAMASWSPGDYERRKLQFEIQKANIYASQLATRAYIVEKYRNLQEVSERAKAARGKANLTPGQSASSSSYDEIQTIIMNEQEIIVKDFLCVLQSISQVNIEPNGPSFVSIFPNFLPRFTDQHIA